MRSPLAALLLLPASACIPAGAPDYAPAPSRAPLQQVQDVPPEYGDATPPAWKRPPQDAPVQALPAPKPAWEARPVTPDAQPVEAQDYTVQPGDTLRGIAAKLGAGSEAIARANGLQPPFDVQAGQRLAIPGGRYHEVQSGQTGIAVARAYGVEWSRIVAANGLVEPFTLRVGQRVLVPGEARGPSAAERAAAFRLDIDDLITGSEPALASNQAPSRPTSTPRRVLPSTAAVALPTAVAAAPGRFLWPVAGQVVKRFGPGGSGERNDGIKIAVPVDTPIKATADGTVAYVGDGIAALGGLIIVRHGGGWTSVYGHASKLLVQRGQAVKRGQTIGLSGATGFADRPELHFELRKGRTPVDPTSQLPRSAT